MADFRTLCSDLLEALENAISIIYHEDGTKHISSAKPIVERARAALADEPAVPAPPADVSQLSDGYHTFAELYEHRHSLMLALMRAQPHICWFSRRHAGGELPFGSDDWFIVGAELPGAPITYHLPAALYSLAQKTGAIELPTGRPWDGHTATDVVQRLRDWAITPAPPADGEVAELVAWLRDKGDCILPSHLAEPQRYKRAAELLQRQVPVPVSERWPEFSDCNHAGLVWCWSWAIGTWRLGCINRSIHSHWLPAQALPVPEVAGTPAIVTN